ncbi:MAG TPA: tRNA pseudouridine(38-40) synthase TruA [Desulfohalobiaceae bacterium]|nr:tRNA pseudouridine(38-40) synthase TruA [Desulfohalobiaceae bacterium]
MLRLKIHIAYTGSYFSGWQVQPGQRTIQGSIEQVFHQICQKEVRVHASGRTDAGVHALDQVAHVNIPDQKENIPWLKALNSLLPQDVAITGLESVSQDFHARFSALGKEYIYILWTNPDYVLPQVRPFVWPVGRLNLQAMDEARQFFCGQHDFSAFRNVGTCSQNCVRKIFYIKREQGFNSNETIWRFYANGFLKQMVRNIMGCLVEVGRGKLAVQEIKALMQTRDRTLLPATAPAKGLCLNRVDYSR